MRTILFLVKFFNKRCYADEFVRGQVHVNRLSSFKQGDNDESGRADRHEGTTAWLQPSKVRAVINGMEISDDLAGPLQLQKNWLNHLHVFCTHACHTGDLGPPNPSNDYIEALRQQLTIDERCFTLGKHAVVIKDVPEFVSRMEASGKAKNLQVACGSVKYYDPARFHGEFRDLESVFWKQEQYSFQREFRFAIDSGSPGELPLEIDIGDMRHSTLQFESTELNGEKWIGGEIQLAHALDSNLPEHG